MTPIRWKMVPVGHLRTWPHNPRTISPERMEQLKRALIESPEMMEARPLIAIKGGIVIAGNQRLRAARELDWDKIPVVMVDLDEQTAREWAMRDNQGYGEWDEQRVIEMLRDMPEDRIDFTGFAEDDAILAALAPEPPEPDGPNQDDVPDPPLEHPDSELGEIYPLGEHLLICGDATDPEIADRVMRNLHAPLLFTSPPYGDVRDYDPESGVDLRPFQLAKFLPAWADHADTLAVNLGMLRRDNEIWPYWDVYTDAAHEAGLKLLAWNVWDRGEAGSIGHATAMWPTHHEFILVYGERPSKLRRTIPNKTPGTGKSGTAVRNADGTLTQKPGKPHSPSRPPGSVFHAPPFKGASEVFAAFPVSLPFEYINAATQPGDVVIDPFGGSGTTLIACEQLGRRCITVEISPAYCDVIRERHAAYVRQNA